MEAFVDNVIDEIAAVARVLVEDAPLRTWFLGLERISPSARRSAFHEMARSMTARGERAVSIAAISALASHEIYDAVLVSVREFREAEGFASPSGKTMLLGAAFLGSTILGAFLLVRSLTGDQSTTITAYFWPGVACLFAGLAVLVAWGIGAAAAAMRKQRKRP